MRRKPASETDVSLDGERLVGNDGARAIHGLSAGSDLAILGRAADPGPPAVLDLVSPVGARKEVDAPVAVAMGALAELAAASETVPLVLAVADLSISVPALLDLLDKPGVATGVPVVLPESVGRGLEHLPLVRVGADGKLVESVGTAGYVLTRPTGALPGLLRVSPGHRAAAAAAWQEVATVGHADADPFALAVLALVRFGVPVQAVPLGPFAWSRAGVIATGSGGSAWQQRLRGASRGGDGVVSTYAVRPLSRKVTRIGLRLGWSPNAVTAGSLMLGVLAAALVATGNRWAWVAAAVVLQASLVIDCVDGEIARFTRRFSAFGAFLDAVGDRVKEYAVFAALALVGARTGEDAWTLAIGAMAVVTVRHLENYAYEYRLLPTRRSRPDVLRLDQKRDLGRGDARTSFAPPPSRSKTVASGVKNVIHMPIAERYLLISLGLLTGSPRFVLWLLIVTVSLSLIWTQGGRTVKALTHHDGVTPREPGSQWGHLDVLLDLGPLARLFGRAVRLPLAHVLDWQLPALMWLVEAVVIATVGWVHLVAAEQGLAFAFLAAVAYHRYDVVYRLRDTGEPAASWLTLAGLGVEGRLLVVLAVVAWAPDALPVVLAVGAVWLAVLYLAESTAGWRRWIVAQRPTPVHAPEVAPAPGAGG